MSILELAGLALAVVHFGIPLAYYWYAKTRWLGKPWNLKLDDGYKPKVTIIIPTYNEAEFIAKRLDNIYEQDYPRELVEVIVVDSASTDGTPEIIEKWAREHQDFKLKLIREPERRGKASALNKALEHAEGEIIVVADADALWLKNSLSEAVKLFSDPQVGAVSCVKVPENRGPAGVEQGYRDYYNVLRVAESKAYATPVFHGELAGFRKELLTKLGGFPLDVGADDSYTAVAIASMGYRAVVSGSVFCTEKVPGAGRYHSWRIRRAQHLIQSFTRVRGYLKRARGAFKTVLAIESYLHLVNPWLLALALALLLSSAVLGSTTALATIVAGVFLLLFRPYRLWILMQLYLVAATVKNTRSRELVWEKQLKTK